MPPQKRPRVAGSAEEPRVILCYGDSNTVGYHKGPAHYYYDIYGPAARRNIIIIIIIFYIKKKPCTYKALACTASLVRSLVREALYALYGLVRRLVRGLVRGLLFYVLPLLFCIVCFFVAPSSFYLV